MLARNLSLSCCLLRQFARLCEANLLNDRLTRFCPSYTLQPVTAVLASSSRMLAKLDQRGTFVAEAVAQPEFGILVDPAVSSLYFKRRMGMQSQRHECPRCRGMMVETYSDVASPDDKGQDVFGQRWVNCGEFVDRLVLLKHWAQQGVVPPQLQLVGRGLSPRRSLPRLIRRRAAAAYAIDTFAGLTSGARWAVNLT